MDFLIVIILVVFGILLMVAELFLLPGISIAGISGILCLGGSVWIAYVRLGALAGNIVLFASLFLLAIAIYIFLKMRTLDKMALSTDIDSKVDLMQGLNIKKEDTGISVSRLAPMGKVKIGNAVVEAKTTGDFIDEDKAVKVIEIENNTIIVEKI